MFTSENTKIYLLGTHGMGIFVGHIQEMGFVYFQFLIKFAMCGKSVNSDRLTS